MKEQDLGPTLTPGQMKRAQEAFREDTEADTPKKGLEVGSAGWMDAVNRDFERTWLGGQSIDAPREDQKGYGHDFQAERSVSPSWREGAEVVCTIVYNHEEETVKYIKPDGTEYAPEIKPDPQAAK